MPKGKGRGTICYGCGGSGKELEMGEETCPSCVGTGRDLKSDIWAEPCIKCNGSGKLTYCRKVSCRVCHGTGTIPF